MKRLVDITSLVLSPKVMKYYTTFSQFITGLNVSVQRANVDTAYASFDEFGRSFTIALGNNFAETAGYKDIEYDDINTEKVYKELRVGYAGLFQHEVGHLLYTDFPVMISNFKGLQKKNQLRVYQIYQKLGNILEDNFIEKKLQDTYTFFNNKVDELNKMVFTKKAWDEYKAKLPELSDERALFAYFSFKYSNPVVIDAAPQFYLDRQKNLDKAFSYCFLSDDGATRQRRMLALSDELYKLFTDNTYVLDIKRIFNGITPDDLEQLPDPKSSENPDPKSKIVVPGSGGEPSNMSIEDLLELLGIDPEDLKGMDDDQKPQPKPGKDGETNTFLRSDLPVSDLALQDMRDEAFDGNKRVDRGATQREHELMDLRPFIKSNAFRLVHARKEYKSKGLDQMLPLSTKLTDSIKILRNKNYSRYTSGYLTGSKLKAKGTMNPYNYKLMQRKTQRPREADLSFTFMVDMSGSMTPTKRTVAAKALAAFLQASQNIKIPTSVYLFRDGQVTKGNYNEKGTTLLIKDFNDSFDSVKYALPIITSRSYEEFGKYLPVGGYNVDENHLAFVADVLKSGTKTKDNVIIILSDGNTCGDQDELIRVANKVQRDGIEIFAVGLKDRHVRDIYENHLVLKSNADLAKLPSHLLDFLKSKIRK